MTHQTRHKQEICRRNTLRKLLIATRACNGMEWNGMEDGMEEEFWYGIWKTSGMERNGRFKEWNGMPSSILSIPGLV